MNTRLNPYIGFRDTAKQAGQFYQSMFGGELTISTFGEFQASEDPAEKDKIMHAMLTSDGGLVLMAADTPKSMDNSSGNNYSVSLSGDNDAELQGYWDKLTVDGTVTEPLERAPWGDSFGMCTDKFGVSWMVNIPGSQE